MSAIQVTSKLLLRLSFRAASKYLVTFFALVGFLLSITQLLGQSPDYLDYTNFFDLTRNEGLNIFEVSRFELGFSLFALVLTILFNTDVVVYSWIVATALLLKGWAIRACGSSQKIFIIVAAFYFVRYFPLHELTQLRLAVAIAFMMVGSVFLWKGNLLYGILIFTLALTFHMSSAAIIPALFLSFTKRWQVVSIALLVFFLTSFFSGLLTGYLANSIAIIDSYQNSGFGKDIPNPFAIQLLIDWVMILVSLIMWSELSLLMKRVIFLVLIGMAIFYGGIEYPVIAHRVREFYSIFWVFFLIEGLQQKTTRLLSYGFVFVSIVFYSYLFFFAETFFQSV